jgi:hypothetical protein
MSALPAVRAEAAFFLALRGRSPARTGILSRSLVLPALGSLASLGQSIQKLLANPSGQGGDMFMNLSVRSS